MKTKITTAFICLLLFAVSQPLLAQSEAIIERTNKGINARKSLQKQKMPVVSCLPASTGLPPKMVKKPLKKAMNPVLSVQGKKFFAYNTYSNGSAVPQGPVSFYSGFPSMITSIADQSAEQFIQGSTWADGQWIGSVYGDNLLVTIDTSTGARTVLASLGVEITGLAYDWTSTTLFAIGVGNPGYGLYSIDMSDYSMEYIGFTGYSTYLGLAGSGMTA